MREEETWKPRLGLVLGGGLCPLCALSDELMMKPRALGVLTALALLAGLLLSFGSADEVPRSGEVPNGKPSVSKLAEVSLRRTAAPPVRSFREQAEAVADDESLSLPTRAERLHDVLLAWARVDLAAATGWILESESGKEQEEWLSTLLQSLAKTQPRLALDHGLALNQTHGAEVVPPAALLEIALLHLTAEDAIRVMETPNPSTGSLVLPFALHPEMDLQKLGDYLVVKAHLPHDAPGRPAVMPSNLTIVWTQRDPAGAYAFAVAMNDAPAGAISGRELVSFASEYLRHAPREEAVRVARELLLTQDLDVDGSELVLEFICGGASGRSVIAEVLQSVPNPQRDEMADYPLLRTMTDSRPDAAVRRMSALMAFGTREGRLEAVRRSARHFQGAIDALRHDLARLGHSQAEIAAALP